MNCILHIEGSNQGYGHPKTDQKKPLRDFLIDNKVYYSLVLKHLRGSPKDGVPPCPHCNAEEILRHYLDRRLRDPKFKGLVSIGLMGHAEKFGKLKGRYVPEALIRQFAVRCAHPGIISRYASKMTGDELARAMLILRSQYEVHSQNIGFKVSNLSDVRKNDMLLGMALAIENMKDPESDVQKIIEMADVALVLHT